LDGIVQTIVTPVVAPERDDRANAIMSHKSDDRLCFTDVVWTETQNIVTGNSERRRRATLADHENVVRIRIRLNHGNF
jgi:hypothetical protein